MAQPTSVRDYEHYLGACGRLWALHTGRCRSIVVTHGHTKTHVIIGCSGNFLCTPNGIRTRAATLKGWCPRPLDDGGLCFSHLCTAWWSGCRDLNPGPLRPERSALPSCATARSELPRSPLIILVTRIRPERSNRCVDHGLGGRVILNDEFADAPLFDGLYAKRPVAVRERRAGHRDLARQVEHEPRDGDVLTFGNLQSQLLFDPINVGLAVHEPTVLANAHDRGLVVFVKLVVEVAHELFQDVANRHHARDPAVLVEHQGEGSMLLSHLTETLQEVEGLGQHERTPDLAGDLVGGGQGNAYRSLQRRASKEVIHVEDAYDIVEVFTHDGKTGVSGVAHRFGRGLGGDWEREKGDVDARGHDVSKLKFTQLIDPGVNGCRFRGSRASV